MAEIPWLSVSRRTLLVGGAAGLLVGLAPLEAQANLDQAMAQVRAAIRDRRKLRIAYVDEKGHRTRRTIWPLAMAYYVDVSLVGAWCELRKDLRNFRVERIASSRMLAARFQDHNGRLLAQWLAQPKERPPSRV